MIAQERFDAVRRSRHPVPAFRQLVQDLAREGVSKSEIYQLIESFLVHLRAQPELSEADEDAVLDLMDTLNG